MSATRTDDPFGNRRRAERQRRLTDESKPRPVRRCEGCGREIVRGAETVLVLAFGGWWHQRCFPGEEARSAD